MFKSPADVLASPGAALERIKHLEADRALLLAACVEAEKVLVEGAHVMLHARLRNLINQARD